MRNLDLIRILDESQNKIVRERSEVMTVECNKIMGECQRRKMTLAKMLEESRAWDKLRKALTTWLTDAQERFVFSFLPQNIKKLVSEFLIKNLIVYYFYSFLSLLLSLSLYIFTFVAFNNRIKMKICRVIDGSKVDAADIQTLKEELSEIHGIAGTAAEMKLKMDELNERSNALLDNYRADEGHNLSHAISKLNALWSKFNDK